VDFWNEVTPLEQSPSKRSRVPRCIEEQSTRLEHRSEPAKCGERVRQMLQDLNCSDYVERCCLTLEFIPSEGGDAMRDQEIADCAFFVADDIAADRFAAIAD
jgi:hypothetical protein